MFLRNIFEALARTGQGKAAVIGWGRGMGHKGHMYLASSVITHADQLGADPYFVVSRTVGKDDPITPEEKLSIYKKVFPEQGHIFQTATDEIPDLTRVLSDLNRQGYTSATIVLGADQVKAFQYLKNYNGKPDKAGNIPYKFDTLDVISRQETSDPSAGEEGPRATPMRAVLMDPTKSEEEQFAVWRDAMNPQISDDEVRDLMMKAKERMTAMNAPKPKKAKAVAEDDAGDVEQRFAAKMEKEKQRLAKLKQTDPEAYKREMEKRKTSSRIPPVSTFEEQGVAEEWSQKYKSSINCSHPKGFSQKAHCASKKKHNEGIEMEAVCPDCGMCEAHGNNKIYNKCWTNFRKVPGKARGEEDSCKKIGEVDDPWGPQGRFAGDAHVDVGGEVAGPKLQVGDLVQVNAGNIKGVGEIWEIKGDQAEVWIDSYARSFNIDLTDLTPYVRSGNVEQTLEEGTSIESTLRAIINDIGEPITSVYDAMKFQAKKYVDNHGELDRGFRMVAAGIGGRWVQNMYVGRLQNELYDLCRYNTRRTVELQEFLRGVETDGELEMKRSFGSIANNLPRILAKLGQHLNAPQLTKNANRWMQNKTAYEEYIANLEAEDDYEEPASAKVPKSNVIGQQNVQVDQIVNSVLSKLPSRIQGDIRNAIARAPNKLQALQAELQKRGVKAPIEEATFKKSPYGKTAASQQRARELLNPPKPPEPKKDEKDTTEHIVKVKGGYELRSKHGNKNLGKYPTRAGAEKRERQVQYFKHAGESVAVEPDPTGYQKDLLTSPENSLVIDTPGDLDWYKLGQHYPSLGTDDPHEYGQSDSDMVIVPYSKQELALLKQKLDRLEMRYKEIGGGNEQPEIHDKVEEKIKGVDGKACWPGKRYAGRVQKADGTYKDKCIPVSEDIQSVMDSLINKIVVNEAIQNNKR